MDIEERIRIEYLHYLMEKVGKSVELYRAAAIKAYERAVDVNVNQPHAAQTLWEMGLLAEDLPDPAVTKNIYQRIQTEFPVSKRTVLENDGFHHKTFATLAANRLTRLASKDKGVVAPSPVKTEKTDERPDAALSNIGDPLTLRFEEFSALYRRTGDISPEWPGARLAEGVPTILQPYAVILV